MCEKEDLLKEIKEFESAAMIVKDFLNANIGFEDAKTAGTFIHQAKQNALAKIGLLVYKETDKTE